MATARRYSAQRRLRLLLALLGACTGAAWGAVAVCLALDPAVVTAVGAHGGASADAVVRAAVLLAAIPVGAFVGAGALDAVSHGWGRRPAILASSLLVALGAVLASVSGSVVRDLAVLVIGVGVGGSGIVVPKLAHELAERGHRRLTPRVRALAPSGAAAAVCLGLASDRSDLASGATVAWMVVVALALCAALVELGLPETPHWYAARNRLGAARDSLRRMNGPSATSEALDREMESVVLDAGMQGEQHPISVEDLRVPSIRQTVLAGFLLEVVQCLPLGLASLALAPVLIAGALADGGTSTGLSAPVALACLAWVLLGALALRRRGDRLMYAWILVGTGLSACGTLLLFLLPEFGSRAGAVIIAVVAVIDVLAQYVCVVPACTGGIDPHVPPWLLRSQRRGSAVVRPLVELVEVVGPLLLALLAPVRTGVAVVLVLQVVTLIAALVALPRAVAALR